MYIVRDYFQESGSTRISCPAVSISQVKDTIISIKNFTALTIYTIIINNLPELPVLIYLIIQYKKMYSLVYFGKHSKTFECPHAVHALVFSINFVNRSLRYDNCN